MDSESYSEHEWPFTDLGTFPADQDFVPPDFSLHAGNQKAMFENSQVNQRKFYTASDNQGAGSSYESGSNRQPQTGTPTLDAIIDSNLDRERGIGRGGQKKCEFCRRRKVKVTPHTLH